MEEINENGLHDSDGSSESDKDEGNDSDMEECSQTASMDDKDDGVCSEMSFSEWLEDQDLDDTRQLRRAIKGFYNLLVRRQHYFTSLAKITAALPSGLCNDLVETLEFVLQKVDRLDSKVNLWYIALREEEIY
ncbi:MAG: hypothetical protein Q9208_005681 [Pyrenodesmia sp. 3 TL-2023]